MIHLPNSWSVITESRAAFYFIISCIVSALQTLFFFNLPKRSRDSLYLVKTILPGNRLLLHRIIWCTSEVCVCCLRVEPQDTLTKRKHPVKNPTATLKLIEAMLLGLNVFYCEQQVSAVIIQVGNLYRMRLELDSRRVEQQQPLTRP